MELPEKLTRVRIPCTRISRITEARRFLNTRAGNHGVLVNNRRRRKAEFPLGEPVIDSLLHIDRAFCSESCYGFTGSSVQSYEMSISGSEEDRRRRLIV